MLKKIFFPLFSVFLVFRSLALIRQFNDTSPADLSGQVIVILVVLLNLFITGIFAFPGFVYPTSKILPDSYYRIKYPKRLNFVYNILGVKYFRIFLLFTFWGKEKNKKKYFNGTKSGLINFDYETRQSEFGHAGAFVVIQLVSLILLSKGHFTAFGLTVVLNVLSNLYPVILQRKHRLQIEGLTSRLR